jgi:alpha-L-rhamnosidase
MNKRTFSAVALSLAFAGHAGASLKPERLRTDGLVEPLATDSGQPALSWTLAAPGERNVIQAACQVQAASTLEKLDAGEDDLWDSGRIATAQPGRCAYAGKVPGSSQRVYWRVRLWEGSGEPGAWSAPEWFETGLLQETDWTGPWIGLDPAARGNAGAYLRGTISLDKPVISARAYISGLGWSELYVNGRRIGDHVLDPAQTDYNKRCFYVAHDITEAARTGENSRRIMVGVILGDGWYNQYRVWGGLSYGQPRLRAEFVFSHPDGTQTTVAAGPHWMGRTGPILENNVYAGENYDARKELGDWTGQAATDDGWKPVVLATPLDTRMAPETMPPVRCVREIETRSFHEIKPGTWIYDFGENVAGWARLKVRAEAGTQIRLRFAERTAPDGTLDTSTTGPAATGVEQIDHYTAKGDTKGEAWQPRFTWHGFRYAELTIPSGRLLDPPDAGTLRSVVLHTDFEMTGKFTSSDEQLNRIHAVAVRTMLANDLGVPSDCPARERCGWTGDAQTAIKYELDNADAATFFHKYARDIKTGSSAGGKETMPGWGFTAPPREVNAPAGLPHMVAPGKRLCDLASPDWGCAIIFVPWQLYTVTGDRAVLDEFRGSMETWADFQLSSRAADGMLETGLGDWCSPSFGGDLLKWTGTKEVPITSTAMVIRGLSLLAKIEKLAGNSAKADYYTKEGADLNAKWLQRFFQDRDLSSHSQTALAFGFQYETDPARRAKIFSTLLDKTEGGHSFATGIFGTPLVLRALSEGGESAVARLLLTKPEMPSYRATCDLGATTLWEGWPDKAGHYDGSLSHPMQGGFDAWLYEDVAGLAGRTAGDAPWQFRWNRDAGLTSAAAEQMSALGPIRSAWKKENGVVTWDISVPPGSRAEVFFPDLGPGGIDEINESGKRIADEAWLLGHEHRTNGLKPREMIRIGSGDYQFSFPDSAK